jgi:hypothetical protein
MNIWTLANTEINQYKSTLSILKLCTCLLLAKTPYNKFGLNKYVLTGFYLWQSDMGGIWQSDMGGIWQGRM